MKTIHFGDGYELSVQGSPWALILYQREFQTQDGKNADFYADLAEFLQGLGINEDGEQIEDKKGPSLIDPFFLLKICWAMAKNYDDTLPSFKEWAREAPIPMHKTAPWMMEVQAAFLAEIFRSGATEETPDSGKGTTRRRTNRRKTNPSG